MFNVLGFLRLSRPAGPKASPRRSGPAVRAFRPTLESLEGRLVPAATLVAPTLGPALVAPMAPTQQAASILPITINSVVNTAGSLVANASLGGTTFQIPLTLSVPQGQSATSATQILSLHLEPIHLDLLGLKVDTSEICLNISAQPGPGNLLGNLLAGVAGALDNGLPLNQVLSNLGADLGALTSGLTNLLNGALGQLTAPAGAAQGATVTPSRTTPVLHLAVGPLNLNLLGLQVNLDNCHNGPVTVDITAEQGPGQLLGNLIGSLAHLLDHNAPAGALAHRIDQIANEIAALV